MTSLTPAYKPGPELQNFIDNYLPNAQGTRNRTPQGSKGEVFQTSFTIQTDTPEFFDSGRIYFCLGEKAQKIWDRIQFLTRKHATVNISQSTLAKYAQCTREHVNRCVQKFKEFGWLYTTFRFRKTCLYHVPKMWLWVDFRKAAKRVWRTLTNLTQVTDSIGVTQEVTQGFNNAKAVRYIGADLNGFSGHSRLLKGIPLSEKDVFLFSRVSEFSLTHAIMDYRRFKSKTEVKNAGAYINSRIKFHQQRLNAQ